MWVVRLWYGPALPCAYLSMPMFTDSLNAIWLVDRALLLLCMIMSGQELLQLLGTWPLIRRFVMLATPECSYLARNSLRLGGTMSVTRFLFLLMFRLDRWLVFL